MMVYTVTFNPSIDYVVELENFSEGKVNRTIAERIFPGGKGINVSMVLNNLGIENTALGFVAGFTGNEIERMLKTSGCNTRFIHVDVGMSRINVKIKSGKESEINGQGPDISNRHIDQLMNILMELKEEDILVLAGSIPDSLPSSVYTDIMSRLDGKKIKTVVDATGELLVNVLSFRPFLIKPNNHEMEEIFNTVIKTEDELVKYGKRLLDMGAQNVLISRAAEGAILICGDGNVIYGNAPEGKVVNSVGAGDSMVAGFICGYIKKHDFDYALKMGLAAGSASAFSDKLATRQEVEEVFKRL